MRNFKLIRNGVEVNIVDNKENYIVTIGDKTYTLNIDFEDGKIEVVGVCGDGADYEIKSDELIILDVVGNTIDIDSTTPTVYEQEKLAIYRGNDCYFNLTDDERGLIIYANFVYDFRTQNLNKKILNITNKHLSKTLISSNIEVTDLGTKIGEAIVSFDTRTYRIHTSNQDAMTIFNRFIVDTSNNNNNYSLLVYTDDAFLLDTKIMLGAKSIAINTSSHKSALHAINVLRYADNVDTVTISNYTNSQKSNYAISINFYDENGIAKKNVDFVCSGENADCITDEFIEAMEMINSLFYDDYVTIDYIDENGENSDVFVIGNFVTTQKKLMNKCAGSPFNNVSVNFSSFNREVPHVFKYAENITYGGSECFNKNSSFGLELDVVGYLQDGIASFDRELSEYEFHALIKAGGTNITAPNCSYNAGEQITCSQGFLNANINDIDVHTINFDGTPVLPMVLPNGVTSINFNNHSTQYNYSFMPSLEYINGEKTSIYEILLRDYFGKSAVSEPNEDITSLYNNFLSNRENYTGMDKDILLRMATLYEIKTKGYVSLNLTLDDVMGSDTLYFNGVPLQTVQNGSILHGSSTSESYTTINEYGFYTASVNGHAFNVISREAYLHGARPYPVVSAITASPKTDDFYEVLGTINFNNNVGYISTIDFNNIVSVIRYGYTEETIAYINKDTGERVGTRINTTSNRPDVVESYSVGETVEKPKTIDYIITKQIDGSIDIDWTNNSDIDAKFFTINNTKILLEEV